MDRILIDVTPEQHNRLEAGAALAGKSIEDYVLDKALPLDYDEAQAMHQLEEFLSARVEEARRGTFVDKSVSDIAKEVYKDLGYSP